MCCKVVSYPTNVCWTGTNVIDTWSCWSSGGRGLDNVWIVVTRTTTTSKSNWKEKNQQFIYFPLIYVIHLSGNWNKSLFYFQNMKIDSPAGDSKCRAVFGTLSENRSFWTVSSLFRSRSGSMLILGQQGQRSSTLTTNANGKEMRHFRKPVFAESTRRLEYSSGESIVMFWK